MNNVTSEQVYQDMKDFFSEFGEAIPASYEVLREQTQVIGLLDIGGGLLLMAISVLILFLIVRAIIKENKNHEVSVDDWLPAWILIIIVVLSLWGFISVYGGVRCYLAPDICILEDVSENISN